jgi:predicted O-methyltransferase YrrM
MRISLLLVVTDLVASALARKKSGHDIHHGDSYHPWNGKDDEELPQEPPASPQHRIVTHMLETVKDGTSIDQAISEFEAYSERHQLGMSLGHEKGGIIERAISRSILGSDSSTVAFLEFGSHIGDGTLRIIRQLSKKQSRDVSRCFVFSFEDNQEWLGLGSSLVRHVLTASKLNAFCKYVPMPLADVGHVCAHIKSAFKIGSVQGIFFDHKHSKFLEDIIAISDKGLLREGTLVMADNALRHKSEMSSFIEYMEANSKSFQLVNVGKPYPDQVLVSEWKPRAPKHNPDEL